MGGIKSKCMAKTPAIASYLDFILYLHGQVEDFEHFLPSSTVQMYRRDMVKIMSKYGKVSFQYEDLYLVAKQPNITPLSTLILIQLHNKGACVPFTCDYRGITISRTFPTVKERQEKRYNYLVACSREMWAEINTCKKATDLAINYHPNGNNLHGLEGSEVKNLYQPLPPPQNMNDDPQAIEIAMALSLSEQENNLPPIYKPLPPKNSPPQILNAVSLAYQQLPVPSVEGDRKS